MTPQDLLFIYQLDLLKIPYLNSLVVLCHLSDISITYFLEFNLHSSLIHNLIYINISVVITNKTLKLYKICLFDLF